jgi:hypothetical protein
LRYEKRRVNRAIMGRIEALAGTAKNRRRDYQPRIIAGSTTASYGLIVPKLPGGICPNAMNRGTAIFAP